MAISQIIGYLKKETRDSVGAEHSRCEGREPRHGRHNFIDP